MLGVNLTGPSLCCKHALPHMMEERSATIAFLLSDDAGYITGAQIPVEGGYLST